MFVNVRACMVIVLCLYVSLEMFVWLLCVCLRVCMHVCDCVCVYGGCVVFVRVSGHVCMVIVCACVSVCMFVNVCACLAVVFCLYAFLAMFI